MSKDGGVTWSVKEERQANGGRIVWFDNGEAVYFAPTFLESAAAKIRRWLKKSK